MLGRIKDLIRKPGALIYSQLSSSIQKPIAYIYSNWPVPQIRGASHAVLSENPPIIHVAIHCPSERDYRMYNKSLTSLFHVLGNRRAYFLYTWNWDTHKEHQTTIIRKFEANHARQFPGHQFIHLCNTPEQEKAFQQKGLKSEFVNHNCLVDEKIFRPIASVAKRFEAVYDARLKPYKRHDLAQHLSSLALVYDNNPAVDNQATIDQIKNSFSWAHYFNHQPDGSYRKLDLEEVAIALNSCHVGLCLSKVEGAMYASIQYLLCGLPVVSTRSQGGRDMFFDPACVEIVDDDPVAVQQGVVKQLNNRLPPLEIRERTLRRVYQHRERFQSLIQHIYQKEGSLKNIAEEWPNLFFNRCLKWQLPEDTSKCFAKT